MQLIASWAFDQSNINSIENGVFASTFFFFVINNMASFYSLLQLDLYIFIKYSPWIFGIKIQNKKEKNWIQKYQIEMKYSFLYDKFQYSMLRIWWVQFLCFACLLSLRQSNECTTLKYRWISGIKFPPSAWKWNFLFSNWIKNHLKQFWIDYVNALV